MVTYSSATGCSSATTPETSIEVWPLPVVENVAVYNSSNAPANSTCVGTPITLKATVSYAAAGSLTYQWDAPDGGGDDQNTGSADLCEMTPPARAPRSAL